MEDEKKEDDSFPWDKYKYFIMLAIGIMLLFYEQTRIAGWVLIGVGVANL